MAAGCLSVVNLCSVILSLHLNTFLRFRLPEAKVKALCKLSQVVLLVSFLAIDFGIITHNIRKLFANFAVALG